MKRYKGEVTSNDMMLISSFIKECQLVQKLLGENSPPHTNGIVDNRDMMIQ
jgi:hypothetical protein